MLAFFGVASVNTLDDVYGELACAFRTSKVYEAKPKALAAWLRLGEVAARDIYCEPYDRKRLEGALPSLRELTLQDPTFSTTKCGTFAPPAASPWSSSQSCVAPGRAA
jgi:HTH-type transcriptional regulator/antitoxin HigA